MTVSTEKRKELNKLWPGLGDDVLDIMESRNKERAEKAANMGLETKEAETEEEEAVEEETETKEAETDAEGQEGQEQKGSETESEETERKGVDIEMLASALVAINERLAAVEKAASEVEGSGLDEVQKQLADISERLGAVEKSNEERTPLASQVADILANSSVVGKESAKVDGRTKLGQDAPEETKSGEGFFFDKWIGS